MVKVLLVEDDEDDYKLTRELLSEIYGDRLAIEWVANYDAALDRLKAKCHDIYLLDYRLGEHSGLDMLQAATALAIQDPIILLTGQGSAELGREAVRMGAADYLVKGSVDVPLLERAIGYAIQRKEIQQTLHRQALTFNSMQDSVFSTNMEGKINDWNLAVERLFGYSKAEALGRTPAFLYRPEEAETIAALIDKGLQHGGPWTGEVCYIRKDSTLALGQTVVALMFDERGQPTGMLNTNHDITESRHAEEALHRHARRQAAIVDLGQRALAHVDISDLMQDAAQLVTQTLGVEYSQVLELLPGSTELLLTAGVGWEEGSDEKIIVGDGRDSQSGYTLHSGNSVLVEDLREETRFTDPYLSERFSVLSGMSVIVMGKTGPYGVLGAYSTQTRIFSADELQFLQAVANTLALSVERKEADEALRESEERFRMTWEVASDAIALSDPSGKVLFANPAYHTMYNFDPGEAVGQTFALIFPPEKRLAAEEAYRSAFNSDVVPTSFESCVTRGDGAERTVESRVGFLSNRGQRTAMLSIVRDITERKQAERELQRSQERFSKAFNASPSPIALSTLSSGHYIDVNDSFVDVTGYSREELIGESSTELGIWADLSARDRVGAMLQESGSVHQMEIGIRIKSGTILDVLFSAEIIELEGEPCVLSIAVDITERKKAEEALRLSSEILQRVNSLVLVSNKEGQITYASPSVKRTLGYEPEDLIGDGWWHVSTSGSSETELEIMRLTNAARSEDAAYWEPYERMVRDSAGELHCILWHDARGPDDQVIGVGHDITERKRLESEREHLFSVSADMMSIAGFDGYFKSVNPAFETTLGISRAELLSKPSLEFVHPDDRAATLAARESLSTGTASISLDNRYLCGDGSYKWLSWNSVSVVEEGLVYAVARDITERLQVEAAYRAKDTAEATNLAKSEFLSRMSHELRTPLNAIIGFSQLLEMDDLNPDQMESVELVHKAGRHLLDLINEVLDISRIEAGHMSLSPEPISVADVLTECLDLMKPLAAERNIMLAADKALQCNFYVLADRQRLKQIILNFLSNAVKYNQVGGSVWLSCEEAKQSRVRIAVSDTGAGITHGKLEKLFTAFERLDADQTGVEGTGLGLALSKRLAEMMGGDTGVESVVGQGSTFWVQLPQASEPLYPIPQRTTGPLMAHQVSENSRTVLYIEDNTSNLRLIEHIFQQQTDIKLLSAMQGGSGFALACTHNPNLILLDLHLPDVHGEKVLEWLRQDSRTRHIPVIIISADATPHEAARLLALGANDYITKPIDVKHFVTVIKDMLERKELASAR